MTTVQSIITIVAVVIGTMLTRFLPFLAFPETKTPPKIISSFGRTLPYAVIGLLVIYCLKDAVFSSYHALPELLGIGVVVILHKWKRNTLLSIAAGTIFYMILIHALPVLQKVF